MTARAIGACYAVAVSSSAALIAKGTQSTERSIRELRRWNMWPDRSNLSKFVMMTGLILSFAVVPVTMAK